LFPITITCSLATTPQPVNQIKSNQNFFESNRTSYQPNRPPLVLADRSDKNNDGTEQWQHTHKTSAVKALIFLTALMQCVGIF